MQLISLAQAGHTVSSDLLKTDFNVEDLNPPVMDGLDDLLSVRMHSFILAGDPATFTGSSQIEISASGKYSKNIPLKTVTSIVDGLKKLYIQKLKPLESMHRFNEFVSPTLTNSDFDAKPMVMLLGQYSTGKTTFIKHLLRSGYPGKYYNPTPPPHTAT
ncbi:hypothetical protein L1987_40473 [Smallanthus sonchifolius]|uniref:Uncharacterized protein n=1 Tax=Smallanthus sonchifolius TaxID=185202 RepID=A0ACB9GVB1_9ASTR|nr:hypothetical protein L1987_40473 [Smallanthus sonchifolius]